MGWILTEKRKPDYPDNVFCWCPVYGRYVSKYKRFEGTEFGEWFDPMEDCYGFLPPKYWKPIEYPEPPKGDNDE